MDSGLEKLRQALESAVEGVSAEHLSWHPEGKWCATEVLEHLYLTYTGTVKGFERMLQSGRPQATRLLMRHRLRILVVLRFSYLPGGREAPAMARPKGLPPEKVRTEIGTKLAEMDAIIAQCEARFGRNTRLLDHPILGPLTAAQWRKFHCVHGRHHEKQILRLREGMRAQGVS